MPKFGGTAKLVRRSFNSKDPLQGAAFCKGFVAKLHTARLADAMSLCSSQGSEERSLVLHLMLTTFAGEEIQLAIDLQECDRLNEFENAVLNQLPYLGESSTFGCELQFVHKDTHKVLVDPIWKTLRDNNCFNVIVRRCFVDAEHKGQLKGGAKPFESHPALLIGYCHRPFRSTWKSGTFR